MDCDSVDVCQWAGIRAYPSVRLYVGVDADDQSQVLITTQPPLLAQSLFQEPQGKLHIGPQNAQQIIEIMNQHLDSLEAQRGAKDEL